MSKQLKIGRVVRLRVNPKDCISTYHAIKKLGLDPRVMTFDQAVRIALSSALEGLRQHGTLPEPTGFEFNECMAEFRFNPKDFKGKMQFTELVDQTESIRAIVPDHSRERRRARFQELRLHYGADPLNHPKPQPGSPEFAEWESLCAEFYEEQP